MKRRRDDLLSDVIIPSLLGALSDTAIRPSVPWRSYRRRTAALGNKHAGCLQLSHVRTADLSADGRRSAASRTAIGGGAYHLAAPGAITCSIQVFVAYLESAFWWVAASSHGVARSGRLGAVNRVTAYHLRQLELVRS